MNKLIAIAIFALASTANAAIYTKFCGAVAASATDVAQLASTGSYDEIVTKMYTEKIPESPTPTKEIAVDVFTKTYYSWAGMDISTVRKLAFSMCELEFMKRGFK